MWDDIRTLRGEQFPGGGIDIIYGGFPCPPWSSAGLRKGMEDERAKLLFEVFRLVRELRPEFVFLENVPGVIRIQGLISGKMESMGYDCRWEVSPAPEADFQGKRYFMLAKARCAGSQGLHKKSGGKHMQFTERDLPGYKREAPPKLARGYYGIPCGVDRVRSLGNSVVPIQAREAFKRLIGIEGE